MDHCSNINTDICYGKIVYNTSVMHSKRIACGCGCRGSVKVSSEILLEKGKIYEYCYRTTNKTQSFMPVWICKLHAHINFLACSRQKPGQTENERPALLGWVQADLRACCYPKEWQCSSYPVFHSHQTFLPASFLALAIMLVRYFSDVLQFINLAENETLWWGELSYL